MVEDQLNKENKEPGTGDVFQMQEDLNQLSNELAIKDRLIEHILLASPNIIYLYDFHIKKLSIISRSASPFLGYPAEKLTSMDEQTLQAMLHPEEIERVTGHYNEMKDVNDGIVREVEFRLRHTFGEWHWISIRETPLQRDETGKVTQIMGIAEDITESRLAQDKIWYLTAHDSLTGLYNRAYFQEELTRMERGRRFPMTVLIADLDNLKVVNDTRGYSIGDTLIRNAAEVLASCFRVEDVVARIGGDEFGVLLPDIASISIDAIRIRINRKLESFNRAHPNSQLQLTIGMASAENGSVLRDAVREAERRMRADKSIKRENRNSVS